jgi:hypothetical protein
MDKRQLARANSMAKGAAGEPMAANNRSVLLGIWVIGLVLRIRVALQAVTRPMHPDATYQGLEIAHYWAYGAGFRASEYWSPATNSSEDFFSTEIKRDQGLGQYAMRSPLFPGLFYLVFELGKSLALNYHTVVLPAAVILFALVTSSIPVSIYYLSLELFNDPHAALMAAGWCAFHHKLVIMGGNTLINSFIGATTVLALYYYIRGRSQGQYTLLILSGWLLGLSAYVRCDLVVELTCFFLVTLELATLSRTVVVAVAFVCGCLLGGWVDFWFYGFWFASPVRWFITNIYAGNANAYGVLDFSYYANVLYHEDVAMRTLGALALVGVATAVCANAHGGKQALGTVFATAAMLGALSANPHKEARFAHNVIVHSVMSTSYGCSYLLGHATKRIGVEKRRIDLVKAAVVLILALNIPGLSSTDWFVGAENGAPVYVDLSFWELIGDFRQAMHAVGAAGQATGVILDVPQAHSASDNERLQACALGWLSLHSPVPIAFNHAGAGRMKLYPPEFNAQYCLQADLYPDEEEKWVLRNKDFNYVIMADGSKFEGQQLAGNTDKFEFVGRFGTVSVLKRTSARFEYSFYQRYREQTYGWACETKSRHAAVNYAASHPLKFPAQIPSRYLLPDSEPTALVEIETGQDIGSVVSAACIKCCGAIHNDACRRMLLNTLRFVFCNQDTGN